MTGEGKPFSLKGTTHHRRSLKGLHYLFQNLLMQSFHSSQHLPCKGSKIQDSQRDRKSASTSARLSSFSEPRNARMNSAEPYCRADPAFVFPLLLSQGKTAKLPE